MKPPCRYDIVYVLSILINMSTWRRDSSEYSCYIQLTKKKKFEGVLVNNNYERKVIHEFDYAQYTARSEIGSMGTVSLHGVSALTIVPKNSQGVMV